ncbi:MAG: hypothetical protein HYZ69_03300 [Candidatus Colwellbacteria bacterium]|nr:hypothetical protein [Candidatus Colwellbacteria bacterium]
MLQRKTALVAINQEKGLVRSKETELFLEKIHSFKEETKRRHDEKFRRWEEGDAKKEMQRFFLPLCEDKLSITADQVQKLERKEIEILCKLLAGKTVRLARFQTFAGLFVALGPLIAAIALAIFVKPMFLLFCLFSVPFSCIAISFLDRCKSFNYWNAYKKLTKHGEQFPVDFLIESPKER